MRTRVSDRITARLSTWPRATLALARLPRRGRCYPAPVFAAIFWDNDGVLVDTETLYYRATSEVLATIGVTLSEDQYIELFLRESRGAWHLAEAQGLPVESIDGLRRARDDRYSELIDTTALVIPGVADTIHRLARRYRMAIVTSSEPRHFERIHRDPAFLGLFEFILTRADYEQSKPHPEPYLRALERSGLSAESCLVVEDSERGLRAAKAAGLTCWVIPSALTRRCRFESADRILGSVAEVESSLLDR
jgi:HAD superfamily hydrolase (TIGR01509 family)